MIDRLQQTPPPLPPRPAAQESQSGVPSFLEWALSNPGADQTSGRHADPEAQHAPLAQSALAVPGAIDPALTLLPPNLPGDAIRIDASHTDPTLAGPRMPLPGVPVSDVPASGALAPGMLAPPSSDPSIAVSAIADPQDAATHMLQCQIRKPQGEREVIALPWRLAAGGRLDQSLRAPGARASDEGALLPGMMRIATRAGDASAAATLGAASAPVVSEWLSRWMKWIERDGHDPVVLLRDYRMDGDETRRVVDTLREFAREHGVVLDRVVVNGHEFWRNRNSDSTRE